MTYKKLLKMLKISPFLELSRYYYMVLYGSTMYQLPKARTKDQWEKRLGSGEELLTFWRCSLNNTKSFYSQIILVLGSTQVCLLSSWSNPYLHHLRSCRSQYLLVYGGHHHHHRHEDDDIYIMMSVCLSQKSSLPPGSFLWPPELPITNLYNSGF